MQSKFFASSKGFDINSDFEVSFPWKLSTLSVTVHLTQAVKSRGAKWGQKGGS